METNGVEATTPRKASSSSHMQALPQSLRPCLFYIRDIHPIVATQTVFQRDAGLPTEALEARDIHEFARRTVRLVAVKCQPSPEAGDAGDGFRQRPDSAIHACTNIYVRKHWLCCFLVSGLIKLH